MSQETFTHYCIYFSGGKYTKPKHNIHMKVIDDKLRIIDDVPSSAVELSVKEKVSDVIK